MADGAPPIPIDGPVDIMNSDVLLMIQAAQDTSLMTYNFMKNVYVPPKATTKATAPTDLPWTVSAANPIYYHGLLVVLLLGQFSL